VRAPELEEVPMPIVGGLDIHRRQITFDYLDTLTGRLGERSPGPCPSLSVTLVIGIT
jgi:hypothetical protein